MPVRDNFTRTIRSGTARRSRTVVCADIASRGGCGFTLAAMVDSIPKTDGAGRPGSRRLTRYRQEGQLPPQSTFSSSPFSLPSSHVGTWQIPAQQTEL
jgi:hypothetical protein